MPAWKAAAVADRRAISRYIAQDNPLAAVDLIDLLLAKAAQLDAQPRMGRLGRVKGTREWVAHSNYVLVYRVLDGDQVEILRVLHVGRQWP